MRIAIFLLVGISVADVFAQSDHIYIQPLLGDIRINGTDVGTELTTVVVGDIIETGSCSNGQLHTNNGSILLGPDARLTVDPSEVRGVNSYPRLQMERGGFSIETPRMQGNPSEDLPNIVLKTPESEIVAYHGLLKGAATNNEGTLLVDVSGQATIRDNIGNTVSMDQYGAKLLQLRNGYKPETSRPSDNPLLAMVLDAISPACVSDITGDGAKHPLIEVSEISFCEGPGWENCTRRQRILEVAGINAVHPANTHLPVYVRTVEVDGSPATPGEGWEVNLSIYRAGDVNLPIENTNRNLKFDSESALWRSQIRTPSQPGKYDVHIGLYCSRQWDRCGTYPYVEWKEKKTVEVACGSVGCEPRNPSQSKGSYITATESFSEAAAITRRENGELVVLISEVGDQKRTMHSTVSTDHGKSWLPLMPVADFMMQPALTESMSGDLILVSMCPRSTGWCFYKSRDARSWTQVSVLQSPAMAPELPNAESGSGAGMMVRLGPSPPYPESIFQDRDGMYFLSYMLPNKMTAEVYVRQSRDLRQWSDPVRVSTGQGINQLSRVMQKDSGEYAIAYYSRSHQSVVIAESGDGVDWTVTHSTPIGHRLSDLGVLEDNGQLALLLAYGANVQILYPASSDRTRKAPSFAPVQGDVRLLVVLEANRILGAVFVDHSDERQDVMFTPITAIDTN